MTYRASPLVLILLLWLAGLGAAGQFAKIAVPFGLFQAHYPGGQVGWLLSIISLLGVIFGMVAGVLVVRLGLTRPLIGALALGAVLSWRQAALPGLPEMLALRLIEGLSHLIIVVAAPTLIATIAPPRWRGGAMTLWSSFFGVAFTLTAIFGLPYAKSHGPGPLLEAHAIWMAVLAAVLWLALRGVRPVLQNETAPSRQGVFARAYGTARIVAPACGWLFYTTSFVSGLAILPLLVAPEMKQTVTTAMPVLGIAVSLLLLPVLLTRFAATQLVITGFLLAAVLTATPSVGVPLHVTALALFAVLGLVQGGSFAAIPQLNKHTEDQALANGVMAQAGNLGNLIGTPLLLAVLGWAGEVALIWMFGALYLAGALVHLALRSRHAPDVDGPFP